MEKAIQSKIGNILNKHFLIAFTHLPTYRRLEHLSLNPMEQMELLWYLESDFAIEFSDQEALNIQTVGDVVGCVEKHLQDRLAVA